MVDITAWLRELRLERYEQAFRENEIDARSLPHLTGEDLKELGVAAIGHRRLLLQAIAELRGTPAAEPTTGPVEPPPKPAEAERRQLTVLFCDLVGSTELSGRVDPEDLRHIMRTYQDACAAVLKLWDGHVAKYMGDGVLAYFGWPLAHEDDAERAVRAGMDLGRVVADLRAPDGQPLAARVGIATGMVVVGDLIGEGAALEEAVVGETPNLAARLQALAESGCVVIAAGTRRLIGGLFDLSDLGPQRLKGFAAPIRVWQVLRESGAESRFEALRGGRLTPIVGRDQELATLMERWAWAKAGDGQVVLISGEPGIGKSRLLRALRQELSAVSHIALNHFCSPYHTNSALYPVITLLERAAGFAPDDKRDIKLAKLEALLRRGTERLDEAVPLIGALLGVTSDDRDPVLNLTPQGQKRRTLEVLIEQLAGLALHTPVVEFYEDVHWIDPSTLELLDLLVERARSLPVLVVLTYRPEFSPPWIGHAHVTTLPLNRLGRRQGASIVERLTGGKPIPAEVVDQILVKADGIPLFIEELTKSLVESELWDETADRVAQHPPSLVPSTLQDSLMARLDRLGLAKETAQTAAVLGREVSYELLAALSPLDDKALGNALGHLVDAELLSRRGSPPKATYLFRHALMQDAAYSSMLIAKRRDLHVRIARLLEAHYPETEPELIARHYTEAGLPTKAADYWENAGRRAVVRSAYTEAIAHFDAALEELGRSPADNESKERTLALHITRAGAVLATKGFTAPQTYEAYKEARKLSRQLGDPPAVFSILRGQFDIYYVRGDLARSHEVAEEFLRLSSVHSDRVARSFAHTFLGMATWVRGELAAGHRHFEAALASYDPVQQGESVLVHGYDSRVGALAHLGPVLSLLGYPDQGLAAVQAGLRHAEKLEYAFPLGFAMNWVNTTLRLCRENQALEEAARRLSTLAADHGLTYYSRLAKLHLGSALVGLGNADEGLAKLLEVYREVREVRETIYRPNLLWTLAAALATAGRPEQAIDAIEEALEYTRRTGDRWTEAELYRLKGEIAAEWDAHDERCVAETCFLKSLEIARLQDAKLWQLRTASSLARLWRTHDRHKDAWDLLAPIYDWFTEGLDTPDLREAKALLDELA